MQQTGFFWHVHHDVLMELCYGYDEYTAYINAHKSKCEIELHIRLMQPVRGQLPPEIVEASNSVVSAKDTYNKAIYAYVEAMDAIEKVKYSTIEAMKIYNKAWDALVKAMDTLDKAIQNNLPIVLTIHNQECQDCPWNGVTIFSESRKEI